MQGWSVSPEHLFSRGEMLAAGCSGTRQRRSQVVGQVPQPRVAPTRPHGCVLPVSIVSQAACHADDAGDQGVGVGWN